MSQPAKFRHMSMSEVQALCGRQTTKISASHYTGTQDGISKPGSLPVSSGLPANWGDASKGDSEVEKQDEEQEESSEAEESSEPEDNSGAEESSKAEVSWEEGESSDKAKDDQLLQTLRRNPMQLSTAIASSKNDTLSQGDGPKSILKRSGRTSFRTPNQKVSFGPNCHGADHVPTKDFRDAFRTHTGKTRKQKDWSKVDPNAQEPPEVTQETTFKTGKKGLDVIVLPNGQKVLAQKR